MNHYLLTGATGVIGSAVLRQLLETPCKIFLPVRAASHRVLDRRMRQLAGFAAPGDVPGRMVPVRADLAAPGLGMSTEDRNLLLNGATHIIHCAGNVRMNLPLERARHETLAMLRNLLSLMAESRCIGKMEYVSTVGVAGCRKGALAEDWVRTPRRFHNTYEAAKAETETLAREAREQGMNITVHRPSMVVGDSRTGDVIRFQVFYHLCEFLSGGLTRGWIPDLSGVGLDIVPSDYVARLLVLSATARKPLPPVLHACAGKAGSISLEALVPVIREQFARSRSDLPPLRRIPAGAYGLLAKILQPFAPSHTARRLATLPYFLAYLKSPQWFENHRTLAAAAGAGLAPPDHSRFLEKVLTVYLENRGL